MKKTSILQGLGFASLASLLLTACGASAGYSTSGIEGETLVKTDGTYFVVDPNNSGESTTMHMTSVTYGRLIDEVYDITGATVLHRNLVVRQDLVSDSDYLLEQNPISRFTPRQPGPYQVFAWRQHDVLHDGQCQSENMFRIVGNPRRITATPVHIDFEMVLPVPVGQCPSFNCNAGFLGQFTLRSLQQRFARILAAGD